MTAILPVVVLERVERRLAVCGRHIANAQVLPGQQRELLGTAVVLLRSIWHIFSNMNKSDPVVARWFHRMTDVSRNDPLLKFFTDERNTDLKEGVDSIGGVRVGARPNASIQAGPSGLTFRWVEPDGSPKEKHIPRPSNWIGNFMGDLQGGGMGFLIREADGSETVQYVEVPSSSAVVSLFYPDAPDEHLGIQLPSKEASDLVRRYHSYWSDCARELRELL